VYRNILEGIREDVPSELLIAIISERTGWTYREIVESPQWLIDTLLLKWRIDADVNKEK
jgi:hypothetical protein